jgi:hypothetical protein
MSTMDDWDGLLLRTLNIRGLTAVLNAVKPAKQQARAR